MRKKMYQLRDVVSNCLVGPILLERNDAPAVRAFYAGLEDAKSQLSQYPQDYELMCLGEYDDEKGIGEAQFFVIARGVEWVHLKKREAENAG